MIFTTILRKFLQLSEKSVSLRSNFVKWPMSSRSGRHGARPLTVRNSNKVFEMYAIVDIASQQFKVEAGMDIFVNRLPAHNGESVEFDKVLLIDEAGAVKVGTPYVEGAVVKATVVDDDAKAKKVLVFKKIRRKGFQTLNGHRQKLTKIHIDAIA